MALYIQGRARHVLKWSKKRKTKTAKPEQITSSVSQKVSCLTCPQPRDCTYMHLKGLWRSRLYRDQKLAKSCWLSYTTAQHHGPMLQVCLCTVSSQTPVPCHRFLSRGSSQGNPRKSNTSFSVAKCKLALALVPCMICTQKSE